MSFKVELRLLMFQNKSSPSRVYTNFPCCTHGLGIIPLRLIPMQFLSCLPLMPKPSTLKEKKNANRPIVAHKAYS